MIWLVGRIPNLPFFYLVYRAWSHWRAIAGGKHINWLVKKKLIAPRPSPLLDQIYMDGKLLKTAPGNENGDEGPERMLLSHEQAKTMAKALGIHHLETELERAVWQVERKLQADAKADADREQQDSGGQDQIKTEKKDQ